MFDNIAKALREIGRDGLAAQVEQAVAAKEAAHSAEVLELTAQLEGFEVERLRLVACSVAALSNTPETAAAQRLATDSPYRSAAYDDVCRAVDREMSLREQLGAARIDLDIANQRIEAQASVLNAASTQRLVSPPAPDATAPSPANAPAAEAPAVIIPPAPEVSP